MWAILVLFWGGAGEDEGVPLIDQVFLGLIEKNLEPFSNEQLKKITQNTLHSVKQNNKEADQNLNFPRID